MTDTSIQYKVFYNVPLISINRVKILKLIGHLLQIASHSLKIIYMIYIVNRDTLLQIHCLAV